MRDRTGRKRPKSKDERNQSKRGKQGRGATVPWLHETFGMYLSFLRRRASTKTRCQRLGLADRIPFLARNEAMDSFSRGKG